MEDSILKKEFISDFSSSIGRHSKSLDTEKKVCGYCHGQFELVQNSTSRSSSRTDPMTPKTPRTPNRFALYVKENYNNVKQKDKSLKHGDVMKELSKQFAEMNKTWLAGRWRQDNVVSVSMRHHDVDMTLF